MKLLRRRRSTTNLPVVPGHASPSLPQQQQRSSSQECTQQHQQQQDDHTRSEFDVRLMPRDQIFRRQLTPWSVHSSGSNCWIATIRRGTGPPAFEMTMTTDVNGAATAGSNNNNNHPNPQHQQQQRQEQGKVRHVQYSFPTEREARKFCKSYAPPKFQSTPAMCQLCHPEPEQQHQQTPSLLTLQTPAGNSCRRTRRFYCRNCGVTVCDNCSTRWGIGMVPPTYVTDISQSLTVRVCKACDWLSNAFCLSLLQGRYDDALILHETGNVNLRTSFADIHREAMLPVHCAVMGGNVQLLRWLVDTQLCPVSVRRDPKNGHRPLSVRTSEGRTLLDLAMTGRRPKVDILMYLIQTKGLSIADVKDSTLASKTLETIMKLGLPPAISTPQQQQSTRLPQLTSSTGQTTSTSVEPTDSIVRMVVEEDEEEEMCVLHPGHHYSSDDGSDNASSHSDCSAMDVDACALCCDRVMDCVLIPCGHQVCCTECGNQLQHCPVCKVPCSVLRVFRQ